MLNYKRDFKNRLLSYLIPFSMLLLSCNSLLEEFDLYQGKNKGKKIDISGEEHYIWLVKTGKNLDNKDFCTLGDVNEAGVEIYTIPLGTDFSYFPSKNRNISLVVSRINGTNTLEDTTDNSVHIEKHENNFLFL